MRFSSAYLLLAFLGAAAAAPIESSAAGPSESTAAAPIESTAAGPSVTSAAGPAETSIASASGVPDEPIQSGTPEGTTFTAEVILPSGTDAPISDAPVSTGSDLPVDPNSTSTSPDTVITDAPIEGDVDGPVDGDDDGPIDGDVDGPVDGDDDGPIDDGDDDGPLPDLTKEDAIAAVQGVLEGLGLPEGSNDFLLAALDNLLDQAALIKQQQGEGATSTGPIDEPTAVPTASPIFDGEYTDGPFPTEVISEGPIPSGDDYLSATDVSDQFPTEAVSSAGPGPTDDCVDVPTNAVSSDAPLPTEAVSSAAPFTSEAIGTDAPIPTDNLEGPSASGTDGVPEPATSTAGPASSDIPY